MILGAKLKDLLGWVIDKVFMVPQSSSDPLSAIMLYLSY